MKSIAAVIEECKLKKEKSKKGYNYQDLWNMDMYLLDLFARMLYELSRTTTSYPAGMTHEEWQNYLNKMAYDFIKINKQIGFGRVSKETRKDFEDVMQRFTEHFFDLWD